MTFTEFVWSLAVVAVTITVFTLTRSAVRVAEGVERLAVRVGVLRRPAARQDLLQGSGGASTSTEKMTGTFWTGLPLSSKTLAAIVACARGREIRRVRCHQDLRGQRAPDLDWDGSVADASGARSRPAVAAEAETAADAETAAGVAVGDAEGAGAGPPRSAVTVAVPDRGVGDEADPCDAVAGLALRVHAAEVREEERSPFRRGRAYRPVLSTGR